MSQRTDGLGAMAKPRIHKLDALDHFSGGVPTAEYFRGTLEDLRAICLRQGTSSGINRELELCLIGLTSYFEAFCKDHFAALVNIEPSLVEGLAATGQDVDIDARRLLSLGDQVFSKLGFVVAERYDFGTSKKVNALFAALLRVTPFSKDEGRRFDLLIRDRNLLVHHGGTYTLSYLEQGTLAAPRERTRAYMDNLVLNTQGMVGAIEFLEGMAKKLAHSTRLALQKYASERGITYDRVRKQAIRYLDYFDSAE